MLKDTQKKPLQNWYLGCAEAKQTSAGKNGKKAEAGRRSSFFTWFFVLAMLGVWMSVAMVWLDLVDYQSALGKLGAYDADGDGDFDIEDAKVLLGLASGGSSEAANVFEETVGQITETSSGWLYNFFIFLYDVMTPFEIQEDAEESETVEIVAGMSHHEWDQWRKTYMVTSLPS
uniref:Cell surface glycoprotein 1-like n=1 Tax=Scleropages formosus TaxID=113540 RepID=A0A8C9QXS9_SCLFO